MGNTTETTHQNRPQAAKILARLAHGNSIDPMQALDLFGCYRLASRINELRKMGVKIATKMQPFVSREGVHGRHAVYWLACPPAELPAEAKQILGLQTAEQ